MSDFANFLGSAFAQAAQVFGGDTMAFGAASVSCVAGTPQLTAALRDSGFFEKVAITATLARADFLTLAIGNRSSPVLVNGRPMKVMVIEDDGTTPIVTVHLQKQN